MGHPQLIKNEIFVKCPKLPRIYSSIYKCATNCTQTALIRTASWKEMKELYSVFGRDEMFSLISPLTLIYNACLSACVRLAADCWSQVLTNASSTASVRLLRVLHLFDHSPLRCSSRLNGRRPCR